ncbi:Glycine--tRNA ligase beta subunit [Sphingomonas antarctica]|uniref:glycine--tRNA ligase subunit beta n=1 Tax=Sphingomonas antarctica TaxID=2040274 RepID=UPI0039E7C47A
MSDFLLELRSEEIPARMQVQAKADLKRLFEAELAKHGLKAASIEAFATPRRLALIARDLPDATEAVSEELKGPRTSAPEQALDGFLRKTGLTRADLTERDGVWFANLDKPGRATVEVLADAIPAIIRAFPWPKSMRWGAASLSTESLRWVRPLQGIVALLGETIVPCRIDGINAGATTLGHRFVHPGPITIGGANDYVEKLRACHVIVHFSERCAIIRDGARDAAKTAGLTLIEDEGLVAENAGLTEWPVPLLGRFDASYLAVPQEIIQLTARVNQKYFVCADADGNLANAFVCTANIDAPDGGAAIVDGNRKVIASRLADAKFFWDNDVRVPLDQQAQKLSQIVFHEKLGTVADKVERVAKLARWLITENIVTPAKAGVHLSKSSDVETHQMDSRLRGNDDDVSKLADLAERAARLCKADLVTGTVGEFPELQGVIGGHLARAQGEGDAVADAIRDHYKPVGQGDDVPTAPVTVAVSLADKLDSLILFFFEGIKPTGSKDPFALRRAALGAIEIILQNQTRISLRRVVAEHVILEETRAYDRHKVEGEPNVGLTARRLFDDAYALGLSSVIDQIPPQIKGGTREVIEKAIAVARELTTFFADRLKVQQREAGVRHDLIDAVFALGGEDDLVRLLARVRALQAFVETPEGTNLLSGYKRAANILKKEGYDSTPNIVTPAEAGVHLPNSSLVDVTEMDSRLRGNDEAGNMDAEDYLRASIDPAEARAKAAIEIEDFGAAMLALAMLRGPIDGFFKGVMVNDPNPNIRARRLGLLGRFRDAVHTVADFSKIEG